MSTTHGNWYRGNLHMHSFWSDGHDFPEVIAQRFKDAGYHFIAFTEHDRLQAGEHWVPVNPDTVQGRYMLDGGRLQAYIDACGDAWVEQRTRDGMYEVRIRAADEYRHKVEEDGRFVMFNGEEVTTVWSGGRHYINVFNHGCAIGKQEAATSVDAINLTLRAAANQDAQTLASFNHPNFLWNADAAQLANARDLRFIEIYTALGGANTHGDDQHLPQDRLWDHIMAKRGGIVFGLATDDCHRYVVGYTDQDITMQPLRAWVVVRAGALTANAIINAMKAGDFYCSTGVTLRDVRREGDTLHVEADEDCTIRFIGTKRDGSAIGETLAESRGASAHYTFRGDELYVRGEVETDRLMDNPAKPGETVKAWTQPMG